MWEVLAKRVEEYEKNFSRFVERVVARFGGRVTLILFGSRAAGTHSPSSDFDVVVVLEELGDYFETAAEILRMGRGLPIDLLLFAREEFKVEGVLRDMLKGAKCLYDGLHICGPEGAVSPSASPT
ncbi:MAG: nucleotidyltransferase domain-containing protein [Thermoproteus sp.]